jgi:hypothetical protein
VATPSTLLVQLITRRQHTDKIPLVCPSRCMLPLCHRAVTYHYGPALVPVVRGYKRRPCPLPFVHAQVLVFAPVSCHHFPILLQRRPPWAARLTAFPFPCTGLGASSSFGAAPRATGPPPSLPEHRRTIAAPVSSHFDAAPHPRSVSKAATLPRHCDLVHGCAPLTPSRRPSSHWTHAVRHVDVDVVHPHHALRTTLG